MSAALAYAGLRALTDCGTLFAYGTPNTKPAHLEVACKAGWASSRHTFQHAKNRWNFVYTLSIDRSRAIRMLAPASAKVAA